MHNTESKKFPSTLTILRRKQVEARTGLSRSSIYARLKHNPKRPGEYDPTFPRPIRIGAQAVGWIEAEIEEWLTAQVERAARHKGAGHDQTQTRSKIKSNYQEKRLNPDQRRAEALTFAARDSEYCADFTKTSNVDYGAFVVRDSEYHADSVAAPAVSPRGSSVYGWRTSFLRKHWQECVYYVAVFLFGVLVTLVASGGFSK